jgi:hypothetical protein
MQPRYKVEEKNKNNGQCTPFLQTQRIILKQITRKENGNKNKNKKGGKTRSGTKNKNKNSMTARKANYEKMNGKPD